MSSQGSKVQEPWMLNLGNYETGAIFLLNIMLQIKEVKSNAIRQGRIPGSLGPVHGISHLAFSPVSSQSKRALRFPSNCKTNQSIESMRQAMAIKL